MRQPWLQYLLAILAGNTLYFALHPYLPEFLRHRAYRIDAGLAMDFVLCLGAHLALRRWFFRTME